MSSTPSTPNVVPTQLKQPRVPPTHAQPATPNTQDQPNVPRTTQAKPNPPVAGPARYVPKVERTSVPDLSQQSAQCRSCGAFYQAPPSYSVYEQNLLVKDWIQEHKSMHILGLADTA